MVLRIGPASSYSLGGLLWTGGSSRKAGGKDMKFGEALCEGRPKTLSNIGLQIVRLEAPSSGMIYPVAALTANIIPVIASRVHQDLLR